MKRVGIVGTGLMGEWHAERWKQLPVELVGFYNDTPASAEGMVERFGGQVFERLEVLVDAVDIVDVCTPTPHHKAGVLAAAAAGKAVVCEKPLARHLTDAKEMVAACEAANVPLFVGHVVRFFPQYVQAQAALKAGRLGSPGVIRLTRSGGFPRSQESWYDDTGAAGGVVLDLSIHDLDFARWCFGEVETVFARGLTFRNKPKCDHVLITLRFENGALGHVEGSWASKGAFRTALEIAGSEGLLEWDALEPTPLRTTLEQAEETKVPNSPLSSEDDPYFLELKHFLEVLETGGDFKVTPQDALAALKLSLACLESLRAGKPIEVATFEAAS